MYTGNLISQLEMDVNNPCVNQATYLGACLLGTQVWSLKTGFSLISTPGILSGKALTVITKTKLYHISATVKYRLQEPRPQPCASGCHLPAAAGWGQGRVVTGCLNLQAK